MSDENSAPPGPPPADPPPPPAAGPAPPPPQAPPHSAPAGGGPVSENRSIFLVLAYLGPLALIPFLIEKSDSEVQWHSKHGLVIFAAEIALSIVLWIFSTIVTMILGPLACLLAIGYLGLFAAILIFHILCIVKALNGERFLVPGVSLYADRF